MTRSLRVAPRAEPRQLCDRRRPSLRPRVGPWLLALGVGVGGFTAATSATELAPAARLQVRALAATCANCHGTEGRAVPQAEVPGLAGQPAAYLMAQMQAFQRGERPATVMHQIARGYSAAQVEALAEYFAALPR